MTCLFKRIRHYDTLDWWLFALSITLVVAVTVVLVASQHEDHPDWNALEYVIPAQIIDEDNGVPRTNGTDYDLPSLTENSLVPVRLIRLLDCIDYECPSGALPFELVVRWQHLVDGEATPTQFVVLEDFESALIEGEDYTVGRNNIVTTQLNPFPVPDEVKKFASARGLESSTWRVEGEVLPGVSRAEPVTWSTGAFVIEHGLAGA